MRRSLATDRRSAPRLEAEVTDDRPRAADRHPWSLTALDWRAWLTARGWSDRHAPSLLTALHRRCDADNLPADGWPDGLRRAWQRELADITPPLQTYQEHRAADGVIKWGLRSADGSAIECVYIPQGGRSTLCLSSQVGCAYNCQFCATGAMGLRRQLTTAEIIAQLRIANARLKQTGASPVSNIVFMGMGEPLANLSALLPAIELMIDDHAFAIARRRVTVSTVGLADRIERLADLADVNLAISLHAANDRLRDRLMPINRRWPLARLIEACRRYARSHTNRCITIEYLMLDSINDSLADAEQLVELLTDLPVKLNLIPFNQGVFRHLRSSPAAQIKKFADHTRARGLVTTIRQSRGQDIGAACGQLVVDLTKRRAVSPADERLQRA